MQINATTQKEYAGQNADSLAHSPFQSNEWATFLQWRETGYKVIKGSKGMRILKVIDVLDKKDKKRKSIRNYTVFNREQVALTT